MVRPVHDAPQIIPLVQTAELDAIAQAEWHACRDIEIVRDQQRLPPGQLDDETLML